VAAGYGSRRDVQLRFDLRGVHGPETAGLFGAENDKKGRISPPLLSLRPGGIYPIGVLFTLAPAPEASARITPDWSVKNIRWPVVPATTGVAVIE
jgi:hypothetical protein